MYMHVSEKHASIIYIYATVLFWRWTNKCVPPQLQKENEVTDIDLLRHFKIDIGNIE